MGMVTIARFPLETALPDIPFSLLEDFLSSREWSTYSIGVRVRDPLQKERIAKAVKNRIGNHPVFRGKVIGLEFPDMEIILDEVERQVVIQVLPVIITGKYTKLTRTIAQTRHYCYECKGIGRKHGGVCPICKGEKVLTKESVQELIAPFFQNAFSCGEVLFHGAGREDVDVRMLGDGRPFALTLENPLKREANMQALKEEINRSLKNKVELFELKVGIPADVVFITRNYHTKRYRALVESKGPIDVAQLQSFLDQKMDVIQTTPTRVEKRRVMKERPHWITLEKATQVDAHHIEVELHASAGCYIKEFISGDGGRSKPSLSAWLNADCLCKELDVLEIVDADELTFAAE
jgi:tRNA pseudouridine synthase 10